ncbi:hypothetical protein Cgig2_016914 [Carnegiea gigantea]|uniref:Uncharacterized protein n=1 Tax=Carnegiea gigantea TaxID=171969 RepID=A0A9Q1GIF6_9CARY|nr:hypothetical protein Cgig2_016914 [Carnegiea gigantea]
MSTMADAITRQVFEQVKRAVEVAGLAKPLPPLQYPLVHEREPSTGRKGCHPFSPWSVAVRSRGQGTSNVAPIPPMTAPPRPQNARKYYEFYEQRGHTTIECRELKKVLHELADKGQIDRFLKKGPRFLRQEQEPAPPPPWDKERSTEVVATITGGYVEEITRSAWKAQLRSVQQVLTVEQGSCLTAPAMVFGGKGAPPFASPHNDPVVVEMKIASASVR